MSIATLKTRLEQNDLGGAFLFFGDENYLIRHYLKILTEKVVDPGTEQMNLIRMEDSINMIKIIEAVETYPIFSERKLVIVKNSGFFGLSKKEEKAPKGKDDEKQQLIDFLKDIPDYCCLIFIEESVAKNVKAFKTISSSGLAVEFARLNEEAMKKWIVKELAGEGKKITFNALNNIISMCTDSMDEIHNEIMKLCNLAGDREEITEEDVFAITSVTIKTAVFEITKALAAKDANRGLKVMDNLLQLNEPVQRLFIMVCKRFGQYLLLKGLLEEGQNQDDAVLKAGFGLNQKRFVLSEVKPFKLDYLRGFVRECHKLDLDIKKGRLSDRMAMELLIARFAQ